MIEEIFLKFLKDESSFVNFGDVNCNDKLIDNDTLQVIVKVQKIELDSASKDKKEYKGGSWHLEGMDYEHILGTAIYYYDVNNINSSYLEFRQSELDPTENDQYDDLWVWENHRVIYGQKSNRYLGKIKIDHGKCITFPNKYQHHVTKFKLKSNNAVGYRGMLVFFIVDPKFRIISTKHVPMQQNKFTLKQAKEYRDELMFARKFYVDEINDSFYEREVTYCEH